MTDRFNTLTVVLENNVREDDAEQLISAIKMLRGVIAVEGNVAEPGSFMAEQRAKHQLIGKILKAVNE